jgi:hypothetical protein
VLERRLVGVPQRLEDRTRGGLGVLLNGLMVALQLDSPLAGGKTTGAQSGKFRLDLVLLKGNVMGLVLLGPEVGYGEALFEVCAKVVHPADGKHDVHAELGGGLVQEGLEGSQEGHLEDFEIGTSHDCGIEWMIVFGRKREMVWTSLDRDGRRERAADAEWRCGMMELSHAKCVRKMRPRRGSSETIPSSTVTQYLIPLGQDIQWLHSCDIPLSALAHPARRPCRRCSPSRATSPDTTNRPMPRLCNPTRLRTKWTISRSRNSPRSRKLAGQRQRNGNKPPSSHSKINTPPFHLPSTT